MISVTESTDTQRFASAEITVLVVDDQVAVRHGLARLIASSALPLRRVATAGSGAEALRLAVELYPLVVVLDVDLDGEDGLALIPQFGPQAGVLVLTCHGDPATRARAALLGARAFVEKHQPAALLLGAIGAIATQITAQIAAAHGGDKPPVQAGESTRSPVGTSSAALSAWRP